MVCELHCKNLQVDALALLDIFLSMQYYLRIQVVQYLCYMFENISEIVHIQVMLDLANIGILVLKVIVHHVEQMNYRYVYVQ